MERGFIPSCRSAARSRDLLHGSRIPGALGHPGRRRLVIEVARGAVHLHKISVTGDFGTTIEVSDSVKRDDQDHSLRDKPTDGPCAVIIVGLCRFMIPGRFLGGVQRLEPPCAVVVRDLLGVAPLRT